MGTADQGTTACRLRLRRASCLQAPRCVGLLDDVVEVGGEVVHLLEDLVDPGHVEDLVVHVLSEREDAETLRLSLEFGSEWTRDEARRAWGWNERRFRLAVATLRELGYPVVSASESGSVYRKARSREEVMEFINRELSPRAEALGRQISAMRAEADRFFGPEQLRVAI